MSRQALGLIETLGMIPAIEAADTCVKSANVKLLGYELATGGLVTVKVEGDVGAVKSAIDAAKASASRVGTVISILVIPRPSEGISSIIENKVNEKNKIAHKINTEQEIFKNECEVKNKEGQNIDNSEEEISSLDSIEEDIAVEKKLDPNVKIEDLKKEKNKAEEQVAKQEEINEIKEDSYKENKAKFENKEYEIKEKKKSDICNLCYDPKCTRKKGQPKNLCIHYKIKSK